MKKHLRSTKWLFAILVTGIVSVPGVAGVNGFVDAQFTSGGLGTANSPTFMINDGAVYFSKELGHAKVMVDIPFMWGAAGTNTFALATNKAQAYVDVSYGNGISWALGQFDSFFGLVENDTVGVKLSTQGQVFGLTPLTHTGWMFGYSNSGFDFKAVVSNSHNQGLRNGDNFEYGGMLKYTHEAFYIGGGYLHHKESSTGESSMIADFLLGTKVSDLTMDAEVALTKAAFSGAETGFSVAGHFGYAINKEWSLNLRPEYLSKAVAPGATAAGAHSVFQVTFGPQHKMTDDLTLKADYTYNGTKALSTSTSADTHTGTLAAVYKW